MIAFKGFNKDMECTMGTGSFKYEIGVKATAKSAKCVSTGLHCCENPISVLSYYSDGRYCIVKAGGDINEDSNDRIACTELTPVKEISKKQLALYACKYIVDHPLYKISSKYIKTDKGEASKLDEFVIVRGKNPVAAGQMGTTLFLLKEYKNSKRIKDVFVYEIDGKEVKENVLYDAGGEVLNDKK